MQGVDTRLTLSYVPHVYQLFDLDRVIAGKRLPYTSRARIIGSLEWLCPRCAKINVSVISPGTWRVTCKRSSCHLNIVPGLRLGVLDNYHGRRIPIPPLDRAFPESELVPWRSGEPINVIAEHPVSEQPVSAPSQEKLPSYNGPSTQNTLQRSSSGTV